MTDHIWQGSDLVAATLSQLGCDYIALNPGASLRGLHDTLVNPIAPTPEMLVCLHEEIAVAIAHGYAKASGRQMAVGLHDTVGLLHASMALFNAWVDRSPMLGIVGTGPLDASERRPWIDWIHTTSDQTSVVRDWCTWTDQPIGASSTVASLAAGWTATARLPAGPAVLALDVLFQEEPVDRPDELLSGVAAGNDVRIGPDPAVIAEVARALSAASRPVLVTDRPLDRRGVAALETITRRTGAALVEFGGGASFDAGHDHDCSDRAAEVFAQADFIMFIDVRDPRFRREQPIGLDVTTVSIGVLPAAGWMKVTSMSATQCDVVADPTPALEALVDSIADNGRRPLAHAFQEFAGLLALPADASAAAPFHPGVLGRAMASAVGDGPYLVANGWLSGWARRTMRYRAGQFLGRSGGEGLGYGLGASIGAALAHRDDDTLVIDFQGDGDFLFTPQALWTAAHHDIPLLVVVEKNGTYYRDVVHQEAVARQRRRGDAIVGPGLNFERPPIDISAIARAQGIATWEVPIDMASLDATLAEAVSTVRRGAPALVEVPLVGMK